MHCDLNNLADPPAQIFIVRRPMLLVYLACCLAVLVGACFAPRSALAEQTAKIAATPVSSVKEFQRRLTGPILTYPTPFQKDGAIDYKGVENMIRLGLQYKEVNVVTLTAGNNQFGVLSYDEVKALTSFTVESVGDRAMVIASTGFWDNAQVLDFARFSEDIGASAIQMLKPDGASDEETIAFFKEVASAVRLPIVLHGEFAPELLRELVKIESVAAMKEDSGLDYLIASQIEFGDRLVIFPGGFDSRYLVGYPYGVRAYYTVFYMFAPELGHAFWKATEKGDLKKAGAFVEDYDYPFAQKWTYPFWVATCSYFGICEPYVRPIGDSLSEQQMVDLKAFWAGLGVRPAVKGIKN